MIQDCCIFGWDIFYDGNIYYEIVKTPSKLVNFCTDQLGQFCQSASWDCTLNINAGRNYNTVLATLPHTERQ